MHLESPRAQLSLTCAILQLLFILFFYGSSPSWIDYPYILTLGLAAGADDSRWAGSLTLAFLAVLSILAWKSTADGALREWRRDSPLDTMAGLRASGEQAREWRRAPDSAKGYSATVLSADGCANLISDEFEKPVALYLIPGLAKPPEVQRYVTVLNRVSIVVVPQMPGWGRIPDIPTIRETMRRRFEIAWGNDLFTVYRLRTPTP